MIFARTMIYAFYNPYSILSTSGWLYVLHDLGASYLLRGTHLMVEDHRFMFMKAEVAT